MAILNDSELSVWSDDLITCDRKLREIHTNENFVVKTEISEGHSRAMGLKMI